MLEILYNAADELYDDAFKDGGILALKILESLKSYSCIDTYTIEKIYKEIRLNFGITDEDLECGAPVDPEE